MQEIWIWKIYKYQGVNSHIGGSSPRVNLIIYCKIKINFSSRKVKIPKIFSKKVGSNE